MGNDERDSFGTQLTRLAAVFGRRITPELIDAYWTVLHDLEFARVQIAVERLIRTAEQGTRFPLPRELRAAAQGRGVWRGQKLSDDQMARLRAGVFTAMHTWERDHPTGSARPAFEAICRQVADRDGIVLDPLDQERVWKQWLEAGPSTMTSAERRALFAAALDREAARRGVRPSPMAEEVRRAVLDGLDKQIETGRMVRSRLDLYRDRDPGEEG